MTNYGTIIDNILHPAPRAFTLDGAMVTNPKAEHFAALNEERAKQGLPPYLEAVDEPPPNAPKYGYHWEPRGWASVNDVWMRRYEEVQDLPPPPRTFSKYKLVGALLQAGVWPQVKEWIQSQEGAYDLYLAAEDISEDEPLLAQGIAAVKELLGWTDEQVEEVLQEATR